SAQPSKRRLAVTAAVAGGVLSLADRSYTTPVHRPPKNANVLACAAGQEVAACCCGRTTESWCWAKLGKKGAEIMVRASALALGGNEMLRGSLSIRCLTSFLGLATVSSRRM